MALKDWKKVDKNMWQKDKSGWHFSQVRIGKYIRSVYNPDNENLYHVDIYEDGGLKSEKKFKTKSQAIRFTKDYMRTH